MATAPGPGGSNSGWFVVAAAPSGSSELGTAQVEYASGAQYTSFVQLSKASDALVKGPYATKAAAEAAAKTSPYNVQSNNPVSSTGVGLAQIGDFFGRLSEGSTWIRVGEVVLGLVLLAVGVARITHAVPIATKVAKTAGAVALA